MRDLGAILQQRVEVKAKWSGDGVDSPNLEIKLDAKAGRAIAMRGVPDASEMFQHQRYGCIS